MLEGTKASINRILCLSLEKKILLLYFPSIYIHKYKYKRNFVQHLQQPLQYLEKSA